MRNLANGTNILEKPTNCIVRVNCWGRDNVSSCFILWPLSPIGSLAAQIPGPFSLYIGVFPPFVHQLFRQNVYLFPSSGKTLGEEGVHSQFGPIKTVNLNHRTTCVR